MVCCTQPVRYHVRRALQCVTVSETRMGQLRYTKFRTLPHDAPELSGLASAALPANNLLRDKIAHRLTWPVGRSSLTKVKRLNKEVKRRADVLGIFPNEA